ncbi:MAG: [FeFe] hydrogenase H-cluster radical SAM maturase HydE [bacterium]|nr:[FeFe] hydrogenase H-cluster radical SAM maturase HydE [bacterium]
MSLSLKEIKELLSGKDDRWLFSEAGRIREEVFGKSVFMRGVIEFSNYCRDNCFYCGLRCENRKLKRYRIPLEKVLQLAEIGYLEGLRTIVLQSGNDYFYKKNEISKLISEILSHVNVVITLSLGERSYEELAEWRKAGAERYLIKVETFSPELYKRYRPERILEERIKMIYWLKELGYEAGSGIIVGLPGQSIEGLAMDLMRLTELELDMIAVGPFIPHPDTPLGNYPAGSPLITLRCIAILRILNPYANIPSTSALASINDYSEFSETLKDLLGLTFLDWRAAGLVAGANVLMPSITPTDVRALYNIYPGKNIKCACTIEEVNYLRELVESCNLKVEISKGYSPRRFYAKGS